MIDTDEKREQAKETLRRIDDSFRKIVVVKSFVKSYVDNDGILTMSLFRLLFMRKSEATSITEFLDREGHLDKVLDAVTDTFHINHEQAIWLYENMWTYAHGIAAMCASEAVGFSDEEIAQKLGVICRGLLMTLHAPTDERTAVIPGPDVVMSGSVEGYADPE